MGHRLTQINTDQHKKSAFIGFHLRPKIRRVMVLTGCAGLLVIGALTCALAGLIVQYGRVDRAQSADVIIVLGGGVTGTERRALHAAALYQRGEASVLLCTGGVRAGEYTTEATLCADVAQNAGVPADAIRREESSRSTAQNADRAAAILTAQGWRDAVLVSDDFHLWRAVRLFEQAGVRVYPSPAQATTGSLPLSERVYSVLREIAAVGWLTVSGLLE